MKKKKLQSPKSLKSSPERQRVGDVCEKILKWTSTTDPNGQHGAQFINANTVNSGHPSPPHPIQ